MGKLPRGLWWRWESWSGLPTASRRAPELEEMAAVVLGVLGKKRAGTRMEWKDRKLVLLLNQKIEGEGTCTGNATAAVRWRRQSRGTAWRARKRAREGELERRSGWGRRVERLGAGGGAGERPRRSTWLRKQR
jgi:hypothetical protein